MKKLILVIACVLMLASASSVYAGYTDIIQEPTSYFVTAANWQYEYRWFNQDWGWQHNAIAGTWTTASLNIAGYDIDYSQGERDAIYVGTDFNNKNFIGYLTGTNNEWSWSAFDVTAYLAIIESTGLYVWMDIDSTNSSEVWAVSLSKSALSLDGGSIPNPEPGRVPEPTTMLLLGLGLVGLAGLRRK